MIFLLLHQIGLAVGDIDTIQQKSVMDRYVMQVDQIWLARVESIFCCGYIPL